MTYSYDGASRRLKAIRYGAETHYVYDASGNLLAETNNTNSITKYYIYGAGLLAMVDAATGHIYCYHFNATGNTIALTDSTQAIVDKYAYTPYGVLTEQQTLDQPFKYVGQYGVYSEPSGLDYMRARYYDPTVGRFISEDPSGFGGGQVNLYAYAGGNPISNADPSGLDFGLPMMGASMTMPPSSLLTGGLILNSQCGAEGGGGSSGGSSGGGSSSDSDNPLFVFGKYPDYTQLAQQLNAYTFNISQKLYDSLGEEEQWAMNQGVLDNAIERGNIAFSNPTSEAVAGDNFSKELQYLKDRGIDIDKIPVIKP